MDQYFWIYLQTITLIVFGIVFLSKQDIDIKILAAIVCLILTVVSGVSAFNIERTVYDSAGTWQTQTETMYEFVLFDVLLAVMLTGQGIYLLLERSRIIIELAGKGLPGGK